MLKQVLMDVPVTILRDSVKQKTELYKYIFIVKSCANLKIVTLILEI